MEMRVVDLAKTLNYYIRYTEEIPLPPIEKWGTWYQYLVNFHTYCHTKKLKIIG